MYKALVTHKTDAGVTASIEDRDDSLLPEGNVLVAVEYSTVNYKDGLVVTSGGGLVKSWPHVPGIDFAGTVLQSSDPRYAAGDRVVLTGWRVGELHAGGYASKARVNADWLVPLPATLSTRLAMAIGTAGFTAMLALDTLERQGLTPAAGDVLVTGAAGGVGSVATALLAARGYRVVASTGRPDTAEYLRALGAVEVIDRSAFAEPAKRPLEAERWAACIDSVGGTTLARVLTQMKYGGSVAAVGLASGAKLDTTVIPFLLRGINLLGIDSVMCPAARRRPLWDRLANELPRDRLEAMTSSATLDDVPSLARDILAGAVRGRVVISLGG
jgi:acrylyl-CoA reductase (NADPH)